MIKYKYQVQVHIKYKYKYSTIYHIYKYQGHICLGKTLMYNFRNKIIVLLHFFSVQEVFSSGYINASFLYGEDHEKITGYRGAGGLTFNLAMLRAHGILCVIAWCLCGAIATTLGR